MSVNKPFAAFTTVPPSSFNLTPMPKLHPHVQGKGLMEGLKAFDAELESWKQSNERNIADQFAKLASQLPKGGAG